MAFVSRLYTWYNVGANGSTVCSRLRKPELVTLGGVYMKKVFTVLMVVSILGAMIGCSKPAEETTPPATPPATTTTTG
ncbi:MAG TPA: hypothetical protein VJ835_12110 [Fimbriimonadaceae bacterium]|nr:hypothetical protein [Fimbriimonadaceae bacterium]